MASHSVFAASRDLFFVWNFRTAQALSHVESGRKVFQSCIRIKKRSNKKIMQGSSNRREQTYHIDDATGSGIGGMNNIHARGSASTANLQQHTSTQDPICCLAASEKVRIVGRESGTLQKFSLPSVALAAKYSISTKPYKVNINCNSS